MKGIVKTCAAALVLFLAIDRSGIAGGPPAPQTNNQPPATPPPTASAAPVYPAGAEISIILSKDRFYPSQIHLRAGVPTTLLFATVNKKPAALVIEPLSVQRWIASDESPSMNRASAPSEITREVNSDRITTISFDPAQGTYGFHDALSGARGEIIVE